MPLDRTERASALSRERRRQGNFDDNTVVLGDLDGTVADPLIPGNVLVSIFSSGGLLGRRSVRGPTKYFPLNPGTPVKLIRDNKGRLQVDEPNADLQLTTGIDPVGQAQAATSGSAAQGQIETLRCVANGIPDLTVWLKAWNPFINGVYVQFTGAQVDLTSFVPSSGNMCYAIVALKSDFRTTEVSASTPRAETDIALNDEDVMEAAAGLSIGSTPVEAVKLVGDQTQIFQSDIEARGEDLRQSFNIPEWVEPPTTASDPGYAGQKAYDATHFYVCIALDTWVRATLATW